MPSGIPMPLPLSEVRSTRWRRASQCSGDSLALKFPALGVCTAEGSMRSPDEPR